MAVADAFRKMLVAFASMRHSRQIYAERPTEKALGANVALVATPQIIHVILAVASVSFLVVAAVPVCILCNTVLRYMYCVGLKRQHMPSAG